MIDCGADWLRRVRDIGPNAIVLTHAHPDHAAGLAEGAPCPVYATEATLDLIHRYPITDKHRMPSRNPLRIGALTFEAFPVCHSLRAPAVGYRVSAGGICVFYVPDVAELPNAKNALRGIAVYIGDGATMTRSMVRKQSGTLIGHAPIAVQLGWCERAGVHRAIFTHCGSAIVRGQPQRLSVTLRQLGCERDVAASLACDGDRLSFGGG